MEFSLNGKVEVLAPLEVSAGVVPNRPPAASSMLPPLVRALSGESAWTLPVNPALDPRVTLNVQSSTDLQTWTDAIPDATRTVWTAGSAGDTKRFFRAQVVIPAD